MSVAVVSLCRLSRQEWSSWIISWSSRLKGKGGASLLTSHMSQQSDGHDRLPQTHLIGQDAVQPPLVQRQHPVEPDVLVLPQRVLQQEGHLPSTCCQIYPSRGRNYGDDVLEYGHHGYKLKNMPLYVNAKYKAALRGTGYGYVYGWNQQGYRCRIMGCMTTLPTWHLMSTGCASGQEQIKRALKCPKPELEWECIIQMQVQLGDAMLQMSARNRMGASLVSSSA